MFLALISGILYAAPFLWPELFFLGWAAFVPLLIAGQNYGWKRALLLGWLMGTTAHLAGYPWLPHLLKNFGGLAPFLAFAGYILFSLYHGLAFGLLTSLCSWFKQHRNLNIGWSLPLALTTIEFIYPSIFPSFAANTQYYFLPFIQTADLGGVWGPSFVIGLINGALYESVNHRHNKKNALPRLLLIITALTCALCIGYGLWRMPAVKHKEKLAPKITIGVIQANIGAQQAHVDPLLAQARYRDMTTTLWKNRSPIHLVVWPESAYNDIVGPNTKLKNLTGAVKTYVLLGALRAQKKNGQRSALRNSLILLDPQSAVAGIYDKIKLLIFGEFIPFGDALPWLYELFPYTARFDKGRSLLPLEMPPWRLAPAICYEDILPSFVRRLMNAKNQPHVIINATNDSWYGRSFEQKQHLMLACFRAIEHRRWLVRSTSTGYSAFIDATGKITQKTGLFTQESLLSEVPMLEGTTLYQTLGPWPAYASILALIILFLKKW